MKKFMKILAVVMAFVLCMGATAAVTVALLQDEDMDVNVMTVGNVYIDQTEMERADDGSLQDFTQNKPWIPVTTDPSESTQDWSSVTGTAGSNKVYNGAGVQDKMVFVQNTGNTDAYFRTLIAIEAPEGTDDLINTNLNTTDFTWSAPIVAEVSGKRCLVYVATYNDVLSAGEIANPSLIQLYFSKEADNEDAELFGGELDVLVLSQAVQTSGFATAEEGLNAAFGEVNANTAAALFGYAWEGVSYVTRGNTTTVTSTGGDTIYRNILSDGMSDVPNVVINEGITRLNNRALCKAPSLESVELPQSLTYIDESVFQQSGIKEITIPENVTYIGKTAFGACASLEKIVINAENVVIANYVARACVNLKEVYIYSDSVTFESGSMYFTNKENADASGIVFYVKDQAMADVLYAAFSTSHSYGLRICSLDGTVDFYNTLK